MKIVTRSELEQVVKLSEDVIDVIEDGFARMAQGRVAAPPSMRIDVPQHHGEVDVKAAYVEDVDHFAIKISSGFFDNRARGLPSGSGMMVLLDAVTGRPQAVLLDEGYLTDVRTAAAGAIAAKYLANQTVQRVGVIGSGAQARWQIRALSMARRFDEVLVYSTHAEHAEQYAKDMFRELGLRISAQADPEAVVRQSDIVVTTTPASHPVIREEWLHPGLHITAMGSDAESKQELEAGILARANRVCCDLISQCLRLGELHHAVERGLMSADGVVELGQLIQGSAQGRTSTDQITVADLTGTGVQDTMIAVYAMDRVDDNAATRVFESERWMRHAWRQNGSG